MWVGSRLASTQLARRVFQPVQALPDQFLDQGLVADALVGGQRPGPGEIVQAQAQANRGGLALAGP